MPNRLLQLEQELRGRSQRVDKRPRPMASEFGYYALDVSKAIKILNKATTKSLELLSTDVWGLVNTVLKHNKRSMSIKNAKVFHKSLSNGHDAWLIFDIKNDVKTKGDNSVVFIHYKSGNKLEYLTVGDAKFGKSKQELLPQSLVPATAPKKSKAAPKSGPPKPSSPPFKSATRAPVSHQPKGKLKSGGKLNQPSSNVILDTSDKNKPTQQPVQKPGSVQSPSATAPSGNIQAANNKGYQPKAPKRYALEHVSISNLDSLVLGKLKPVTMKSPVSDSNWLKPPELYKSPPKYGTVDTSICQSAWFINYITALHNFHRNLAWKTWEHNVEWDPSLALMAQQWADRMARFDMYPQSPHRPDDTEKTKSYKYANHLGYAGENCYSVAGNSIKPTIDGSMRKWWDEEIKKYYQGGKGPEQGWVDNCGHYIAMVWKNVEKIGAGIALTKTTKQAILVCNYWPHPGGSGKYNGLVPDFKPPTYKFMSPAERLKQGQ